MMDIQTKMQLSGHHQGLLENPCVFDFSQLWYVGRDTFRLRVDSL